MNEWSYIPYIRWSFQGANKEKFVILMFNQTKKTEFDRYMCKSVDTLVQKVPRYKCVLLVRNAKSTYEKLW